MLFENKFGKIMMPEEVNDLSCWEIDELGIHVTENLEV